MLTSFSKREVTMTKLWELTKTFDLQRYFSRDVPDVRVQLRGLFDRTKETIQREKQINLEVVLLIGALEQKNPAVNLRMWGGKKELAMQLGLTLDQYLKRAQAGRVVGMLAAKLTEANKEVFLKELPKKSEKEIRHLIASVNPDGSRKASEPTFDLKITLTESQLELLARAQEVLSSSGKAPSQEETLMRAVEDLLEKRDPVRKAARARRRKEQSHAVKHGDAHDIESHGLGIDVSAHEEKDNRPNQRLPIAAALKHRVYTRDRGQCQYPIGRGQVCGSKAGIQIDHLKPVALGGGNRLENLRLCCREHNIMAAEIHFGAEAMARYQRWRV